MQKGDIVEKRRVLVDNEELPGLVKVGALPKDEQTVEVPGFRNVRTIKSGVTKIAPVDMTYKVEHGTKTRDFINSWKENDEVHDVVVIQCDATGQEFGRYLLPQCMAAKTDPGEADLGAVTFAHIDISLIPWDIQPVRPQQ